MSYIKDPMSIEKKSFQIIDNIIKTKYPDYKFQDEIQKQIIQRCIHTSADFDYLFNLKVSPDFYEEVSKAIKNKATIYTDTTMAMSGINKKAVKELAINLRCLIAEEETAKLAKEKSITRSMASVQRLVKEPGEKILVCGNAPTFLYMAIEQLKNENHNIKAIIGAPVGFVEAKESKDLLNETKIPQVVALGRKGGSNIAAAIVNAVLYTMVER